MGDGLSEKAHMYERLCNAMMARCFDDDFVACDRMAHSLLLNADLPVIMRVRCDMLLSTAGRDPSGAHTNFLTHAHAAVHLLRDARAQGVVLDDATFAEADQLLVKAQADHAAHKAAGLYNEEKMEQTVDGDDEEATKEQQTAHHPTAGVASSSTENNGIPTSSTGEILTNRLEIQLQQTSLA